MLERTILLDGFSKTYAMTGWRCGYAAVPEALVEPLVRFFVNSTSCVPPFVQLAGVAALTGPQDDVAAMVAEFAARRDLVVAGLNALPGVSCRTPRGAFYAFPNVSDVPVAPRSWPTGCWRRPAWPCSPAPPSGAQGADTCACPTRTPWRTSTLALERMHGFLRGL